MTIILKLLLSLSVLTALAEDRKVISSDLNKDGKDDYVEIFENKKLVERKEDLDFDGTFDRQTLFHPATNSDYFKLVNEKKPGSKERTRISYWHDKKLKKTFSLTQIDKDDDGKWDTEFQTSSDINQHNDDCEEPDTLSVLIDTGLTAARMSEPFVTTSWGHQIHQSCLNQSNRDWFLKMAENSMKTGLSCLDKLAQKGGRGAAGNKASVENLLNQKNVQIICDENDYDWGEYTLAHATTSNTDKEQRLRHPGISFNPKYLMKSFTGGKDGERKIMSTLFHEQLHNLGYLHGHDIEYSYTCGTCCFPEDDVSKEARESACKICSGNYTNPLDISYIRDISSYAALTFNRSQAVDTTMRYLKANPGNVSGLTYLALNTSGVFDPVGGKLANRILSSGDISSEEKTILEGAVSYNDSDLFKPYQDSSKAIADAYYASYHQQNPEEAIRILSSQSSVILKQMSTKNSDPDSQYVVDSIKKNIKRIVFDVWLDNYSGKQKDKDMQKKLNKDAYELFKLYNL